MTSLERFNTAQRVAEVLEGVDPFTALEILIGMTCISARRVDLSQAELGAALVEAWEKLERNLPAVRKAVSR